MALLFWDASALTKRYAPETGSDAVDLIFANALAHMMGTTAWGYAEAFAILVRKLNGGRLDPPTFASASTSLQAEVIDSLDFTFLTIDDAAILAGISLIQRHNLNSADAAILSVALRYARSITQPTILLIAADHRLLRAARSEGMTTLNPESPPREGVAAFLSAL
jgi:predicted nucleic acid-binding protein